MPTSKLNDDLTFIKQFLDFCKNHSWRMVVYGGYGLDGYLSKITRKHGDIDLVIYGQTDRVRASEEIILFIKTLHPNGTIRQKDNPFQVEVDVNDSGFGLNLYYVQTRDDPFVNINTVVKDSGEIVTNDPTVFPPPKQGMLMDLVVEVQNQGSHLKDILTKGGATESKYISDLKLLYPLFSLST